MEGEERGERLVKRIELTLVVELELRVSSEHRGEQTELSLVRAEVGRHADCGSG